MDGNLVVNLDNFTTYTYIPSTLEVDTNVYNNYLSGKSKTITVVSR